MSATRRGFLSGCLALAAPALTGGGLVLPGEAAAMPDRIVAPRVDCPHAGCRYNASSRCSLALDGRVVATARQP